MNFVKWLRKNNKKLMAAFVVAIMLAFLMPQVLQQLSRPTRSKRQVIAYFGADGKITNKDLISAQQQLRLLRLVPARNFLLSRGTITNTLDLHAALLAELLFPETAASAQINQMIKQIVQQSGLRISNEQIDDFFVQAKGQSELYWLLLKNETKQAGYWVYDKANDQIRKILTREMPRLTGGYSYSDVVGSIVNRQGIPEEQILTTFAELATVWAYAKAITSTEDVTGAQIMHTLSRQNQGLDVELVEFDASVFADQISVPSQEELIKHFEQYKKFFPGQTSAENPYGFGYKLPDRVQLEYIAVKADDVAETVAPPEAEETEEYYHQHINEFVDRVPADVNDPNSNLIEKTRSYAEVAALISEELLQRKINLRAERILNKAKQLTEIGLEDVDIEQISTEEFKKLAGDYQAAAETVGTEYDVKIYTGQSGLISAEDFLRNDRYLGTLYMSGVARTPVSLAKIVFAIDELGSTKLGPFDVPKPRTYENIGPLKDPFGQISVLVRIIAAYRASEPKDINQTYDKTALKLGEGQGQGTRELYSVKDKAIEDYKQLKAMDIAKERAKEFAKSVEKADWDKSLEKFNRLYGKKTEESTFKTFQLQNLTGLQRTSGLALKTFALQVADNPDARALLADSLKHKELTEKLYSLLPEEANIDVNAPLLMEYKPYMKYYVIKSISQNTITQDEYERAKASIAYAEDNTVAQSLSIVHFNPENILKRMNFKWAGLQKQRSDVSKTTESNGAL